MPATLTSRLPAIAISLTPRVRAAMAVGAHGVAEEAEMRCPRSDEDKPHLADAIHVVPDGDGWSVVAGDDERYYGHMVENGSVHNQSPHPFLVPALESQRAAIEAAVTAALRKL